MTSDLQDLPATRAAHLPAAAAPPMELTIVELRRQHDLVQQCMREVMVEGHHFGVIPGTDRKALLKPGIEKLCALFQLTATYQTAIRELPNGHREYRATCTLTHRGTGVVVGNGEGSCSTMESKYRWRLASRKCPDCQQEAIRKSKNGPGFYCWSKIGGCGAQFPEGDRRIIDQVLGRIENVDIADQWNTVLKMAQKRAASSATQSALACSDIFAEDDEQADEGDDYEPKRGRGSNDAKKQAPKMTRHQELCRDCAQAASALGASKEKLADLLSANGIQPPAKWGDLDEATLVRAKAILETKLKEGNPL